MKCVFIYEALRKKRAIKFPENVSKKINRIIIYALINYLLLMLVFIQKKNNNFFLRNFRRENLKEISKSALIARKITSLLMKSVRYRIFFYLLVFFIISVCSQLQELSGKLYEFSVENSREIYTTHSFYLLLHMNGNYRAASL